MSDEFSKPVMRSTGAPVEMYPRGTGGHSAPEQRPAQHVAVGSTLVEPMSMDRAFPKDMPSTSVPLRQRQQAAGMRIKGTLHLKKGLPE